MANSFNIPATPEISLVKAVVDAILLDTVEIVNVKERTDKLPDDPAEQSHLTSTELKVDTLLTRATTIIAKTDLIDAVKERTDRIPDLPAHQALLPTIDGKLDTLYERAELIRAKTDLLPQNFRGTFLPIGSYTDSAEYVTFIDVPSGSGYLLFIILLNAIDTNLTFRLTIDGKVSNELSHDTVDSTKFVIPFYSPSNTLRIALNDTLFMIPIEFSTSLKLELKKTLGAEVVTASAWYCLDP
ncbi:hypothetical protein ES708_28801 [subsurface metagenome]